MELGMDKGQFLFLNMSINNKNMLKYFKFDSKQYKNKGETKSLYSGMNPINLVLRLMDNRNFITADNEIKKEMIYSDYYPQESKTSLAVYHDDRRNLCQELHNQLCGELGIPETLVILEDFDKLKLDVDMFHFYDPHTGKIYINTGINYSNCGAVEMAEAVIRATHIHELHNRLRTNIFNMDKLEGEKKYLLYSLFLKQFITDENYKLRRNQEARDLEFNDGYSSSYVYATYQAYDYLDKLFRKYKLEKRPELKDFYECMLSYKASLTDLSALTEEDEEQMDDSIDYEEDDSLLYDTLSFDMDLLYSLETSELNDMSDGLIFETVFNEMSDTANDFYSFFGYDMENFEDEYDLFKAEEEASQELEDMLNEALEEE